MGARVAARIGAAGRFSSTSELAALPAGPPVVSTAMEQSDGRDQPAHATVRRKPDRGHYDRDTVHAILDEGLICHVGFVWEGRPVVIPTSYARIDDALYLHGSPASRMLRTLAGGIDCCVTVTLLDELVLARSAFNHSMNYRSVVAFGHATPVTDLATKGPVLDAFVEHIIAGRAPHLRATTEKELRGTSVLVMPIDEASAKVRTGQPIDDDEDYAHPVWAGILPVAPVTGQPVPDPRMAPGTAIPDHVSGYHRPQG